MAERNNPFKQIASKFDRTEFRTLHEEMSFPDYLDLLYENPRLARNSFQWIYDMIMSFGAEEVEKSRRKLTHYNFFDTEIAIYGIDETLDRIGKFIKGAAGGYGTDRRILLLHGPVGSSKSTIARRFKRGMEKYSRTDEGKLFTFRWVGLPTGQDGIYTQTGDVCPMYEDPLKLLPPDMRAGVLEDLNAILLEQTPAEKRADMYTLRCEGDLNPRCKKFMEELLVRHDGDWEKVVAEHVRVFRFTMSEADRRGIATFQPKDEKNQDSTELTGDINYAKLPHYGSDSDSRAFNFDGELCAANRGMIELIEMLKLSKEFLYDLLGASQEKQIKPKKFAQIVVDEMILSHTNHPEFEKLVNDNTMEALRDRIVKVNVPYLLEWSEEIKVLSRDYGRNVVRKHVAPHTVETAALWLILTRLEDEDDARLDLVSKAKLYNGEILPGYTEEAVEELRKRHPNEGMHGVSVRYVQDKISDCLSNSHKYINPFMVMNEIREGLDHHSLITNKEDIARYQLCAEMAVRELEDILKDEVRKALVGNQEHIETLCANYIDNVMAYIKKAKVKNKYTGRDEPPNERLMRSIEEKIEIPQTGADDFRRMIAAFIGDLANQNKKFRWDSNIELRKALEAKMFEDVKDHIKLSALSTSGATVVQPELQEKIDAIKQRLITQNGYTEESATDVLDFVGGLFSRGEVSKD